jgi:hypothetical protein
VILLKVVAAGTSTLSKLFMIDVTSNIILIMGIWYLKSHQSCLQILTFSGRGVKYLPTSFKRRWLLATYFSNIAPYSSPYWQPWDPRCNVHIRIGEHMGNFNSSQSNLARGFCLYQAIWRAVIGHLSASGKRSRFVNSTGERNAVWLAESWD